MRKKLSALFAAWLLALAIVHPVQAQQESVAGQGEARHKAASVTVLVDGAPVEFGESAPFIDQDWTLAPLGPLYEALNIRTEWRTLETADESGTAGELEVLLGTKLGLAIIFLPGAPIAEVNGAAVELPATARIVDGELYVPLRTVAEAAGYAVGWEGDTKTIRLERRVGGQGFLWEVNNGDNKVYLLGSIHIADGKLYPLPPVYETAFDEAEVIGFEIDMQKALLPESAELMAQYIQLGDGTTLKDHISEDTYALLGEKLTEMGLPADAFDTLKPWAVAQALTGNEAMGAGYTHEMGIELYFQFSAAARQLPIVELESIVAQLEMFDRFSPELQEQQLLDVLNKAGENAEELAELLDMWISGDDGKLAELADGLAEQSGEEYYNLMLVERNIGMVEKIIGYLNADEPSRYLIIVGALHMLGKDGIIPLLEEAGYTAVRR